MANVNPRIGQWLVTAIILIALACLLVQAHHEQYLSRNRPPGSPPSFVLRQDPLADVRWLGSYRKWEEGRDIKTYVLLGLYAVAVAAFLYRTRAFQRAEKRSLSSLQGSTSKGALILVGVMAIAIALLVIWVKSQERGSPAIPRNFLLTLFELACGTAALWFRASHAPMRWWQGLVAWLAGVVFGFFPIVIYMRTFAIGAAVFIGILAGATLLLWIAYRPTKLKVAESATG